MEVTDRARPFDSDWRAMALRSTPTDHSLRDDPTGIATGKGVFLDQPLVSVERLVGSQWCGRR
ncbi:MAG: hypothetical protein ACREQ5_08200 [Candidatus Dormibacteria bacterium]